jgi:sugar/nucleoside kinase (ribokinase family)
MEQIKSSRVQDLQKFSSSNTRDRYQSDFDWSIGGQNVSGKEIIATLEDGGVDVSEVKAIPDVHTGYAHTTLGVSGTPKIVIFAEANEFLTPIMSRRCLRNYPNQICCCSSSKFLKTVEHLARLAKQAGVSFFLNAAPSKHITRDEYLLV